ncbi:MAG: MarR family transcriptional regulator [Actinomycetota bacterium]
MSNSPVSIDRTEAPQTVRLDDQLCFALYAATNAVTRGYRPMLDQLGITYPQYLVLLVLWEHPSRAIGEIAEELHMSAATVSPIIDRLELNGLAVRSADPDDGRRVIVELTDRGTDIEPGAAAAWNEIRCRTMLETDELQRLRRQLLQLVDRMDVP